MFQPTENRVQDLAYVVGLDPSLTSFGVYCLPINHDEWYGFSLQSNAKDGNDTSRVVELAKEVADTLLDLPYPVAMAAFEDYGPINRTSGKITQRAEICGTLKSFLLIGMKVPIISLPPTSLKSFATGNARASKEDMLTRANNYGYWPDTHDEADAFFAARACENIIQGRKIDVSFTRVNPR